MSFYYAAGSASGQNENQLRVDGCLSVHDGLSCPLVITCFLLQANFLFWPYNVPFIDQACSVEMCVCWCEIRGP